MKANQFWEDRWSTQQIGWDLGQVSPPIANYIKQLSDKNIKILIPRCGNAYEAEYLIENGFTNVFIVEIAKGAIDSFVERYPKFPKKNIIHSDFFEIDDQFDLIIEQTFFCAINPELRQQYVKQMTKLLKSNGKLAGLLFNTDFAGGPPFGGDKKEYLGLFSDAFNIDVMSESYNSIKPRQGKELFIILRKK